MLLDKYCFYLIFCFCVRDISFRMEKEIERERKREGLVILVIILVINYLGNFCFFLLIFVYLNSLGFRYVFLICLVFEFFECFKLMNR